MIKKVLLSFVLTLFIFPSAIHAQEGYKSINEALPDRAGLSDGRIENTLNDVVAWIAGLLAIIALLTIVIAGIMYMTSGGDEGRIDTAKRMLLYAIIGLVVALLGYVTVNVIATVLGAG